MTLHFTEYILWIKHKPQIEYQYVLFGDSTFYQILFSDSSDCRNNSLLLLLDGNFPQKLTEKPVTIEGNPVIGLKKSNQTLIRLSDYIKKYDRFARYRIKSMKGGCHLHLLVFPFVYHFHTRMIAQVESTFWNPYE